MSDLGSGNATSAKGGAGEVFATTRWTVVLAAGRRSGLQADAALGELCRTYWFPLYSYVRRQGHSREDAVNKPATLNTETKVLSWTVSYKDLTGPAVGAHFHGPSEPGKNAGIALPFKTVQSPIEGTATLSDTQVADLLAGKWYANIHTAANPGGELRGNMVK